MLKKNCENRLNPVKWLLNARYIVKNGETHISLATPYRGFWKYLAKKSSRSHIIKIFID